MKPCLIDARLPYAFLPLTGGREDRCIVLVQRVSLTDGGHEHRVLWTGSCDTVADRNAIIKGLRRHRRKWWWLGLLCVQQGCDAMWERVGELLCPGAFEQTKTPIPSAPAPSPASGSADDEMDDWVPF